MSREQDIEEAAVHWERARVIERNETIEECARVVEAHTDGVPRGWSEETYRAFRIAAAAIRALKDSRSNDAAR